MAFPDSFSTERLRAERLTPEHLPELRRMHSDATVMAHLGGVKDEAGTRAYLERNLKHWAEYGFGLWILHDIPTREVAGRGVLRHLLIEDRDEVEVGYGFYTNYWGRGLATEIAAECIRLGREKLGLTSIVALTARENIQSHRVLIKAGMTREADVRYEGEIHALFRTVRRSGGGEQ